MRVYLGNKTRHEIRVVSGGPPYGFTGDPTQSQGLWGSLRIATENEPLRGGPSVDWWGDSVYAFRARCAEYNEQTITLGKWKADGWPLAPGVYRVRSWFNGREGKSAAFVVTQ